MAIRFACPGCGAKYSVPEKLAGKRTACTKCKRKLQLPTKLPKKKAKADENAEPAKPAKAAKAAAADERTASSAFDFFDDSQPPEEEEPEVIIEDEEEIPMELVEDEEDLNASGTDLDDDASGFDLKPPNPSEEWEQELTRTAGSEPVEDGQRLLSVRLNAELVEAFVQHATKTRRTFEAELEIAMEERLAKFGRWETDNPDDSKG